MLRSSSRLLGFALSVAAVATVTILIGGGALQAALSEEAPWAAWILGLTLAIVLTGAFATAVLATLGNNRRSTLGVAAGCALTISVSLTASHLITPIPLGFYFVANLIAQTLYTYALATLAIDFLDAKEPWVHIPARLAAGAVLLFGTLGCISQAWIPLERVTMSLALVRDLTLAALPLALMTAFVTLPSLRLDPKSWSHSLKLRLPLQGAHHSQLPAMTLMYGGIVFGALLNVILHLVGHGLENEREWLGLGTMAWSWLGVTYASLKELHVYVREERQALVTARLATSPARRFLERHIDDRQAWAATVGLRTANFIVDHDPGSMLAGSLPASLMQIRAEEIQRCVAEVLGSMYLHSHVVGPRIFGAVDSENSIRPCVDTLRMFSCLYLDAGPLVERRIKGLTALLPIVDPGLAGLLKPADVASLIRRNLWFFHFDFGWIDQHLIHTPKSTRYDVRLTGLGSRIRLAMMEHLEKTGGAGNFVWLGPDARDRLLQEAPFLGNIIEACPLKVRTDSGKMDEQLMFTIKFEQLIPRLQRYFDLDSMREPLLDFEPSSESLRLQSLINLQISRARTAAEVMDLLDSITSTRWRGFREKDNALHLILAAFDRLCEMLTPGSRLSEAKEPKLIALHAKVLDAVRVVGYPSQILHHAQVNKIALRDLNVLVEVARDPKHPRFEEAWLLLGTADYRRYQPEQRLAVLEFLVEVSHQTNIADMRLVQVKAVDALTSVGRNLTVADHAALSHAIDEYAAWFASHAAPPDVCCLFLDAQAFLARHLDRGLNLSATAESRLGDYFQTLLTEFGAHHPQMITLMLRWQKPRPHEAVTAA